VVPTRHSIGERALTPKLVLAPWDLSQNGAAGMPLAASLARELSARLMLVHVADRRALPALGLTGEQTVFGVFPAFEALAKNRMHAWTHEYAEELEVEIVVREGRPHLVLAGLAEDPGAGLVVVSPLGLGAETRKLLGSTVGKLLRVSPCPVLVVR
jgi:nucleotide-binding universal stress UspA family protein